MTEVAAAGGARRELLDFIRDELIGPAGGPEEVLAEPPHRRYLMATLYPRNAKSDATLEIEIDDGVVGSYGDELEDDPVSFAHEWMPSSVGISFFTRAEALEIDVQAAVYKMAEGKQRRWQREPGLTETVGLSRPAGQELRNDKVVFDGHATVGSLWRPYAGGYLITVTMMNDQIEADPKSPDATKCLYQVALECRTVGGPILEYPAFDTLSRDQEDEELRLIHRKARLFAVGHGCAAFWEDTEGTVTPTVRVDFMPEFELRPLRQRPPTEALSMSALAKSVRPDQLAGIVSDYRAWIDDQRQSNADIPERWASARDRILARLDQAADQIDEGVTLLRNDELAREAFRLANLAMVMQMHHAGADLGGVSRERDTLAGSDIDYMGLKKYVWHPFQMAFILLVLPSVFDEHAPDRGMVDLLWFPTGGGKTEAYLAIAAFALFLRRLRLKDGGAGTVVITRYTLRLLTAQQFQRGSRLICACELIRSADPDRYGERPITIGLWVGNEVTPGTFEKARELYEELREDEPPKNKFQLESCPWCGTRIVPKQRDDDDGAYGIRSTNSSFSFYCPSVACSFHGELPISVVDQDLYESPPSLLIATVDKFARLTWEERGGAFFGHEETPPPSLIIQDELHLLSGPLGTTMGLYEAAIEALITLRGVAPKVIASTATIRHADDQVRHLFGRQVRIFPPTGLDASDSFFAEVNPTAPGRLYVGIMAPSHTMASTIRDVSAAILEGPAALGLEGQDLDAYWTLVLYHNSLRELGRTVTLARDDIPARILAMTGDEAKMRRLRDDAVVELTSNVSGDELPGLLERMTFGPASPQEISVLATTNMLSVGVDVQRLGLMAVIGQPKTTAEYIQATSRVGRSVQAPGLVVSLFAATKPRDRSHYERFRPYHGAVYRYVEPTSVTPFSPPSRERALHAALVILLRHGAGLGSNAAAHNFSREDPQVAQAVAALLEVARAVDPREAEATEMHLTALQTTWEERISAAQTESKILHYQYPGKGGFGLLKDFGARGDGWPTLHSMRNVDRQAPIVVKGEVHVG